MGLEREMVACVGSSSTAAHGTYDWIAELGKRPRNERFRFLNFGVGGDLSHNVVRRLDAVAAMKPDRVIVLIGSNDILATVSRTSGVSRACSRAPRESRHLNSFDRIWITSRSGCASARRLLSH
jgi:lysophospholipase L1-like esterase